MNNIPAFDIQAVCSGFIYSLQVADSFIRSGKSKTILVIGAETLSTKLYSDGSWHDSLFSDGGPSKNQEVGKIRMNGKDIFKQAVNKLTEATNAALKECNLEVDDIRWFIPHQANQRIISSTAKKIGISLDKTISTVEFHANTSAASIPLALSSAVESGRVKKGDIIALCAIGGGLTWGSCILKI